MKNLDRRLHTGLLVTLLAPLGSACGGEPAAPPDQRVPFALPSGADSVASIHTLPGGVCTLRAASEAPGTPERLTVLADDEGVARLYFRADPQADHAALELDCEDGAGGRMRHAIDVTVDPGALPQAREPSSRAGEPTILEPRLVADPVHRHGPRGSSHAGNQPDCSSPGFACSSNWSGYVITPTSPGVTYSEVQGTLLVPSVTSTVSGLYSSSLWAGIDGWGNDDVVQCGTEQDVLSVCFGRSCFHVTSYYAWFEWYPAASQMITNFPVAPGDTLSVSTSVDATGAVPVATFNLRNDDDGVVAGPIQLSGSTSEFHGTSAEWIMERPSLGISLTDLADYSSTEISGAYARDSGGATDTYTSDDSWNVTMTNGADTLSTVAAVGSAPTPTMRFTWLHYD